MNASQPNQENSYFSSEPWVHILEVIGYVLADGAVTPREVGRMYRAFGTAASGEPREVSAAREAFADRVDKDNGTAEMATLHMHLLSVLALASGAQSPLDRPPEKAPEEDVDGIAAGDSAADSVMRDRMSKALDGAVLSLAQPGERDRFYVFLLEEESPGLYTVAAFYGKKGRPPKESQAKKHPAPLPDARSSFDYAVCGKLRQGYTVDGMTAAGVANKFRYSMEEGTLVTHKQLQYIKNLGGIASPEMTREKASAYIDMLLGRASHGKPSVRQRAVLRFWNREDMLESSREEVSDWMDGWYAENPARQQAWEIWKDRVGDDGMQNPALVTATPPGKGFAVLREMTEKAASPPGIPGILKSLFGF